MRTPALATRLLGRRRAWRCPSMYTLPSDSRFAALLARTEAAAGGRALWKPCSRALHATTAPLMRSEGPRMQERPPSGCCARRRHRPPAGMRRQQRLGRWWRGIRGCAPLRPSLPLAVHCRSEPMLQPCSAGHTPFQLGPRFARVLLSWQAGCALCIGPLVLLVEVVGWPIVCVADTQHTLPATPVRLAPVSAVRLAPTAAAGWLQLAACSHCDRLDRHLLSFWAAAGAAMGRKGGGRTGFMKAARAKHESDEEELQQQPEAPQAPAPAPEPVPSKAAAFLKDPEPAAASDSGDSDEDGESGVETRGKMLQRHKRVRRRRRRLRAACCSLPPPAAPRARPAAPAQLPCCRNRRR